MPHTARLTMPSPVTSRPRTNVRLFLCFDPARNGGAAAADPSLKGQRWKKKMEAANLRAAREAFRERNPLVRVGYTSDGVSVLKVMG